MNDSAPAKFDDVSVTTKANVYFDGKVVSHTIHLRDGAKKTLGIIYPGSFHFTTDAPERMDIVAGTCRVKIAGEADFRTYSAGSGFDVPGKSAFDIAVESGLVEYVCSFK
jgi:uncharacterized protein YaiE (UPF0345 family)